MALKVVTSGQGIGLSYYYTVTTNLDEGKVPNDSNFLNLHNNIIYYKSPIGIITPVGTKNKLSTTLFIEPVNGSEAGIVAAFDYNAQLYATQLTKKYNIVSSVLVSLDSVKCYQAVENMQQIIQNRGGNDMRLYPYIGDKFYGMAINAPLVIADGNGIQVYCYEGETGTLRFN